MAALTKEDVRIIVREETDHRFNAIDQRFDKMDQRLDKMDQRFDKMDQRMNSLDERSHGQGILLEDLRKTLDIVLEVTLANQKALIALTGVPERLEKCESDIDVVKLAFKDHASDKKRHRTN